MKLYQKNTSLQKEWERLEIRRFTVEYRNFRSQYVLLFFPSNDPFIFLSPLTLLNVHFSSSSCSTSSIHVSIQLFASAVTCGILHNNACDCSVSLHDQKKSKRERASEPITSYATNTILVLSGTKIKKGKGHLRSR